MARAGHRIIVIGASAGGLEALDTVIGRLPPDLRASIFIVQHMDPENTGQALLDRLSRHKAFTCKIARDGDTFKNRTIYIAPADFHLLIKAKAVMVTKGARENRYRPAIDPMFRSAAVAHGPNVVGVVLTGMLDDGTSGLIAIAKCGGLTVVQDPKDAAYPEMPKSALSHLKVDHCVPASAIGPLLGTLVCQTAKKQKRAPKDIQTEARIAERVLSSVSDVDSLGQQEPYNCPNCGGVLWEMDNPDMLRYRCHTGHSFTASSLIASQSEKVEETLWIALRMLEERKNLLTKMAQDERRPRSKTVYAERIDENDVHIERIRELLLIRH